MCFGVDFSSRGRTEIYVHLESVSEKFHRQYRSVNPGNKWVLLVGMPCWWKEVEQYFEEEQEHTRVRCYSDTITKHFHFLGLLKLKEVAIFCGTDLFSGIKYQFWQMKWGFMGS